MIIYAWSRHGSSKVLKSICSSFVVFYFIFIVFLLQWLNILLGAAYFLLFLFSSRNASIFCSARKTRRIRENRKMCAKIFNEELTMANNNRRVNTEYEWTTPIKLSWLVGNTNSYTNNIEFMRTRFTPNLYAFVFVINSFLYLSLSLPLQSGAVKYVVTFSFEA